MVKVEIPIFKDRLIPKNKEPIAKKKIKYNY